MATDGCGDASAVQGMALELFQLASLLVGDQGLALDLIERSLATMEIDPCLDPEMARNEARRVVARGALEILIHDQPAAFAVPADGYAHHNSCVQDDDLSAAGITADQLQQLLDRQGDVEGRKGLRDWLESLPVVQRTIFVQRAVMGQGNDTAAGLLRQAGGEVTSEWTPSAVSETFRQALCALANSLAHAPSHSGAAV
jgi:hypothetical protein